MLKVIVIDDERLVRMRLIHCLKWEEINLEIVGEASSIRLGMELIEQKRPDIVFMDVRMPGINGLEGSRMILGKYPKIKIIILSGHNEFDYASEAIKIGVFDYLLKPINEEEVRAASVKVRDVILKERSTKQEYERYKEELEKHRDYLRDRQIGAFVRSADPRRLLDSLNYFGVPLLNPVFQVALVDSTVGSNEETEEEEKLLIQMDIRQLCEDYFSGTDGIFVCNSGDRVILLNNASEEEFDERLEGLKEYIENNQNIAIAIGVGNCSRKMEETRTSYREAKDALKYHFVSGGVTFFRDIYPYYSANREFRADGDSMHEFGNALRVSNTAKAMDQLNRWLEDFRRSGSEREQLMLFTLQVVSEIMKVLIEMKIDVINSPVNFQDIMRQQFTAGTFEEICDYLRESVRQACTAIGSEFTEKEKTLSVQVEEYIQEHFAEEDISLNAAAGIFFVNASYLSRIFKEKTGSTFSNYLFNLRMQEAERLALNTTLKGYEIAEKIGIPDPHYFSSCFKKFTGSSISDYRKQNGKG